MYRYEHCTVTRVIDGDTFVIEVDLGFKIKTNHTFRLKGADTAETYRPRCPGEKEFGEQATQLVRSLLIGHPVVVETYKVGIYNRYIADIFYVDPDDPESGPVHSLKETLIQKQLLKRDLDCRECSYFDGCQMIEEIYKKLKLRWRDPN